MKKMLLVLVALFTLSVSVQAVEDRPITVDQLPQKAQQFIKKYFADKQVALAKMETDFLSKSYDVIFTNGDKVEFDKKGNWTKVDCEHTQVPQAVIPAAIQQYVSKNYPDAKVVKIEKTDRKGFDVDLSNGFDIEFDKKMRVVEIDR